jgi:4-oxalocrotonate tautomerase
MPHIIVKLHPGRTEEQKQELTAAIVRDVMAIARCPEPSVSVAFEEVSPADWPEKVYKPDILETQQTLYKKPGYKNPFE